MSVKTEILAFIHFVGRNKFIIYIKKRRNTALRTNARKRKAHMVDGRMSHYVAYGPPLSSPARTQTIAANENDHCTINYKLKRAINIYKFSRASFALL